MNIITSFSQDGYVSYGKRFVETWEGHSDLPITVYHEGTDIEGEDLRRDFALVSFLKKYDDPMANGIVGGKQYYQWQACKFAHKVFAMTRPPLDPVWHVWIDADVEITAEPDFSFLDKSKYLAYIGREDWHHSETGFIAFNLAWPVARAFLERLRWYYTSGMVFSLAEWHDAFVFDRVREDFAAWKAFEQNIADGIGGMHPWPQTPLGNWSIHHKGPQAKARNAIASFST